MTEADAITALANMHVSRETLSELEIFVRLVLTENRHQNLIAKSTEGAIWDRHILDSAQLAGLACDPGRCWLDVGAGAGFPGMVLALMTRSEHVLVDPRRRRAEFLSQAAETLGLDQHVRVVQATVEKVKCAPVNTITARAVSSIDNLLSRTRHLADDGTSWLLHKGRNAVAEIQDAKLAWNARFEMIPSVTDVDAVIVRVTELAGRRE